ncbi:MAG: crotonase [Bacteroidetes bacterium GWF2_38_335]|nr:MAG: crotonase [Bacteroidetes bacterium GWF2_38_335]HBS86327.1 crotonase [Bacteroidales bacterium]
MNYEILILKTAEGIATITINRPEAMNALNSQFYREMNAMLDQIEKDASVKVVVITGSGKAFVAGADIAEMTNMSQKEGYDFSKVGQNTFARLENFRVPVIAAINGFALGGGLELALGCDFRIASSKAKFGQPEVNLGLIPGYAATQRLSRLIGPADALFLITTGEMITAQEALTMRLVQKVVEPEELMNEVNRLAQVITTKGPVSVKTGKETIRKGFNMTFAEGSELEAKAFASLFTTPEMKEGTQAFLEKRKPNW